MNKLSLVLLIDDSDADNHFHTIIIKRTGVACTLKSVDGSLDGIDYLHKALSLEDNTSYPMPQLIFLDINMPGLNGFELLEKFREAPDPYGRKEGIKIFMLTGSLNPDDKARAQEHFSDLITGFLIKPLTKEAFKEIVAAHFFA